ncbi:MAG TPA: cupin domain-containing protein [Puia sp.]|nr:cupin domain-containing protein [Puia sp.]
MAFPGKQITNSKNGQTYRFIQTAASTGGKMLEMESVYVPNTPEPILHYHPRQDEYFRILDGEVTVRIGTEIKVLHAGDELHIPAGAHHGMWNPTNRTAIVNWKTIPALETEYFFETITGLVNDGKTDQKGKPRLLQTALTINYFSDMFRLVKPPYAVQKILFYSLTPLAWIMGYRAIYKKYLD